MQIAIKHENKLLNLITPNACNWVNGSQSNVSQGSNETQEVMWKHEKLCSQVIFAIHWFLFSLRKAVCKYYLIITN